MVKNYISLLCFLVVFQIGTAQYKQLSSNAEISIITAGPGKILYEGFGHSAIRIKDIDFDLVYNYGIFDFDAPDFYLNFIKGKLLYKLQKYPFHYFVRSYNRDKRWIKEQILNLTQKQKQLFYEYLENNAKPENASYYYDPFFNNCATKLRGILEGILQNNLVFNEDELNEKSSFRQLMNDEVYWNTWGSFGINLIGGNILDANATAKQHMYLPDYVYSGFKNAEVIKGSGKENLVKKENIILNFKEIKIRSSILNPFLTFSIITVIGLFITYRDYKRQKRTKWLDATLFFLTGFVGLVILILWFFSDHSSAPNNLNFLWAFAPNLIVGFYMIRKNMKKWIKRYLQVLFILLLVIPFIWLLEVQQFPLAISPFLILLFIRYLYLLKEESLLPFKK